MYYIKKLLPSVRGLFAPTGHSFHDTAIWFSSYDPKFKGAGALALAMENSIERNRKWNYQKT